ncbi:O-methyltransferase [Dactylonectria estremocensis]|uniref:O-methyltransferase n=1 Tax=Dactylonectria estremocensis TaxID=1079267 RepID=A0A9P9EPR4_9HYPO|nr:O-methyltransferase [Dactylonectria estremocensis]
MSTNKAQLLALSGRLTASINALSGLDDSGSHANRQAVLAIAHEIVREATLPEETWLGDMTFMCTMTASRLFIKWGAFDAIPVKGVIGYDALAERLKLDKGLFRRVGAVLAASKILHLVGDDHLAHTPKSLVYVDSSPYKALSCMSFDETLKTCAYLPEYVDQHSQEPQGPVGCPYTFANGEPEKSVWEIMNKDPERMRIFMQAMSSAETLLPASKTYDLGWVKNELDKHNDRMLFIDIGGSKGHALQGVCEANEWLPRERCMLQDRKEVIDEVTTSNNPGLGGVKMMAHDFYLEQPVKGALVYHLRRCLHDYGDEISIHILRHISDAMAPDSRLLIVEQVCAVPPSLMDAQFDFVMMTLGGKERNATQFENLVREVGLKIHDIHKKPSTPISVIECVKE